jgi:hypothetical protein
VRARREAASELVDVLRAKPFETEALTGVRPAERAAAERAGRLPLQRIC